MVLCVLSLSFSHLLRKKFLNNNTKTIWQMAETLNSCFAVLKSRLGHLVNYSAHLN